MKVRLVLKNEVFAVSNKIILNIFVQLTFGMYIKIGTLSA